MTNNHNHRKHRPGLLWPFILIAIGIAFLFQNLGLLGGSVWNSLIRLWPLLLILLGLNDLIRTRSIVGPTISIGVGAIFMANNLGILSWTSWMAILRLWPVIIITIGLEIFLGRKNIWLSAVGVGVALSLLAAGLWLSGGILGEEGIVPTNARIVSEEIEQSLGDAETANIRIDSSVGELSVESHSRNDNLIQGTISTVEQEVIREHYELDGDEASYFLGSDWASGMPFQIPGFEKNHLSWDISLTEEIPLNLNISLGVGESDLDLSDLQVSEVNLDLGVGQTTVVLPNGEYQASVEGGVGQTTVTLPDKGQIKLNVEGGVGEIVIRIPKDMAAQIHVDRGIVGLNIPSGYIQSGDTYTSPNYDQAKDHVELYLEQGIGSIAVREK
ncbi:MAG: hypothetical protein ISR59_11945 [Anaerolineales bacterium]|uniref:DUF5668 domain-containing protein n=1 Tax=Candidatus Desulfolinea nitratireducens TaxID=2841698 RepID=A0A8J6NHV5_9CHLR|nr:hypothetical protein [Candidatus Desulfolinea nitratireducens]MBL6961811.1 hypothetical protein [Anaerolineales bacterium]